MAKTTTQLRQELRALKAQLAAAEEARGRMQSLVDHNPAATYRARASGDFGATFVSAGITAQTGWPASAFTEEPSFWLDHVHPDHAPRVVGAMSRAVETGSGAIEYRFQHKDGSYLWARSELRYLPGTGKRPPELVGYWTDVTERRQAEEHLRESEALFRALTEHSRALVVLTEGARATYVNPRVAELTGYTEAELLAMDAEFLVAPEGRSTAAQQLRDRVDTGHVANRFEVPILTKDGRQLWLEGAAARIVIHGQTRDLFTAVDITARKAAEAERAAQQATLAERVRFEQLLSAVAGTFAEATRIEAVIDHALDLVRECFDVTFVAVGEFAEGKKQLPLRRGVRGLM